MASSMTSLLDKDLQSFASYYDKNGSLTSFLEMLLVGLGIQ